MPPVMNDESAATANTAWLHDRLQSSGTAWIPPGTMYVNGTATTAAKVGCGRVRTWSPGGYPTAPHPTLGKCGTRIVQNGTGPILRLAGAGFVCDGPIELVGDGVSSAIEIEGRSSPATGYHAFNHVIFKNWDSCFSALAGYYNGGFQSDEAHADNCLVNHLIAQNCVRMFKSTNQQAVIWTFNKVFWGWDWSTSPTAWSYILDIVRGGKVTVNGLEIATWPCTMVRVDDFSPNNSHITLRDVSIDRKVYDTDSVTITRSGTTATVTHTAHDLVSGMRVLIAGANQADYNGSYIITVTGTDTYTYTVANSPATPATGTVTATPKATVRRFDYNGSAIEANYSYWKFKLDNCFSSVFIHTDDLYDVPGDLPQTYWDVDYTTLHTE